MTNIHTENFSLDIPVRLRPSKLNEGAKVYCYNMIKDVIAFEKKSAYIYDSENFYQVIVMFPESESRIYNDMADKILKSLQTVILY